MDENEKAPEKKYALEPLNSWLFIVPDQDPEMQNGIFIPDSARNQKPLITGFVIAAGPGQMQADGKRSVMSVKLGDQVLFGAHAGNLVTVGGVTALLVEERNVLGVLKEVENV